MNTKNLSFPTQISNQQLLAELKRLAGCEREAIASIVAHLAELDARELYLAEGFSSLFYYCLESLRLSEDAAYNRTVAARAARKFPLILEKLADGSLNLTIVRLLAPHLTADNHAELLAGASGKSKFEVQKLLARHFPQPPVPSSIRKLPTPASSSPVPRVPAQSPPPPSAPSPPSHRPIVAPLAPERYRVQFTASAETYEDLRRAQELLRHQIPDGNPAEIIGRALKLLVEDLTRRKLAATDRPRPGQGTSPGSRHIPAEVKRAVSLRDGEQCAFVAASGRRCRERGMLEYHHVTPYAAGGEATVDGIELRCRAHNQYEAELYFGPSKATRNGEIVREAAAAYGCTAGRGTRSGTVPRRPACSGNYAHPVGPLDRLATECAADEQGLGVSFRQLQRLGCDVNHQIDEAITVDVFSPSPEVGSFPFPSFGFTTPPLRQSTRRFGPRDS